MAMAAATRFEGGRTVLLHDGKEVDRFDGLLEAYAAGHERYGKGNFHVQTIGLPAVATMMTFFEEVDA